MKTKSSEILLLLELADLNVRADMKGNVLVSYAGCEIKDGVCLVSSYGRGLTFEEACDDYLSQIRGKTLVFNAGTKNRKEVVVLG